MRDRRNAYSDEQLAEESAEGLRGPSVASRGCGLVGCVLVIALLAGFVVGGLYLGQTLEPLADRFLWAPHDVTREYFDAYRRADAHRAQRLLCRGVTGVLDPYAPFASRLGSPFVEDEFPYPREGGRVAIYYRLEQFGPRAQAVLQREEEGWRICAFER